MDKFEYEAENVFRQEDLAELKVSLSSARHM